MPILDSSALIPVKFSWCPNPKHVTIEGLESAAARSILRSLLLGLRQGGFWNLLRLPSKGKIVLYGVDGRRDEHRSDGPSFSYTFERNSSSKKEKGCRFRCKNLDAIYGISKTGDTLFLLRSDGFWDVITTSKAEQPVIEFRVRKINVAAGNIATLLVNQAEQMRTRDNTSVVFLDFERRCKPSGRRVQ